VVEFTLPYVNFVDFVSNTDVPGNITIALLSGTIATSDATTAAQVNFVVWSAADTDCQFSNPFPTRGFQYPSMAGAKRQCNIQEAFSTTFAPFVEDCTESIDNHSCLSETTLFVTDIMKRYQITSLETSSLLPPYYNPVAQSLGLFYKLMFVFHRGGISYKVMRRPANNTSFSIEHQVGWVYPGDYSPPLARGQTFIASGRTEDQFEFSVPYYGIVPFYSIAQQPNPTIAYQALVAADDTSGFDVYTCVRDDYMVGMLRPPYPILAGKAEPTLAQRRGVVFKEYQPLHKK